MKAAPISRLGSVMRVAICAAILLVLTGRRASAQADPVLAVVTYFGGKHFDRAQGVAVDGDGFIYFIMNTESTGLPTRSPNPKGPFQRRKAGPRVGEIRARQHVTDAYVGKLSPDGRRLVWGTYLGGRHSDRGYTLKVNREGYVYCSIWTGSADFPTTAGAFDRTYNGKAGQGDGNRSMDLAIVKLRPDGSGLVWSTYLGGGRLDQARNAFDIDAAGNVYVAGLTNSPDFPVTPGAPQGKLASPEDDGFVCKLAADGSRLIFSTFLGGAGRESAVSGVRVHKDGTVFVAGMTRSTDFPVTAGALQRAYGGDLGRYKWMGDAFVARLAADGKTLLYSTYLGGSGADAVAGNDGLAVTAGGEAVVIVDTTSRDLPLVKRRPCFQGRHRGGGKWPTDGYVARLSADGATLKAATYFGGTGTEQMSGIDLDAAGNVHFSGNTHSTDFPLSANAVQATHGGQADVFYAVLSADLTTLEFSTLLGGSGVDRGRELVVHPDGFVVISGDTQSGLKATPGAFQERWAGSNDALLLRFDLNGPR